jgi:hypothetical protein
MLLALHVLQYSVCIILYYSVTEKKLIPHLFLFLYSLRLEQKGLNILSCKREMVSVANLNFTVRVTFMCLYLAMGTLLYLDYVIVKINALRSFGTPLTIHQLKGITSQKTYIFDEVFPSKKFI